MKALRFVLLAIALTVVSGLGWRLRHPDWSPQAMAIGFTPTAVMPRPSKPDPSEARAMVLSRLADAPAYSPFFEQMRAAFPNDYLGLVDRSSLDVENGAHVPNPDRLITEAMRRLRQSRGILAAQAEARPLSEIFQAQSALLEVLAVESPVTCVDVLYGGTSPDFMAFAAKHRDLVERLALASLDAVMSGKAHHVDREQPRPEDFDSLEADLKSKGFSGDEIAAVLDGKTFDPPLPEARLCAAGRTYLQALASMPEDARLRVYALSAALLARS